MRISDNISKISWTAADKATFVLYGIASIALLKITNSSELGLFTLFNNLHNLIFAFGNYIGFQALLHFSVNENEKPVVNLYAMLNIIIIVCVLNLLVFIFKISLSNIFNEPNLIEIINALPIIMLLTIPRLFNVMICYRETEIWRLFISNLVYFGTMSGMIFYAIYKNIFLYNLDLINITYIGSISSVVVGTILNIKYWKFKLPNKNTIKYKEIISYSAKFSIGGIAITIPRTLDVYAIQYFFGINIVGIYAPAKTIFRFVEDLINAMYQTIYAPTIKYFSNNDIENINKLISKLISLMVVFFTFSTIFCYLFCDYLFAIFLPQKFINAIPIFNELMIASILLPFTLLNTVINAEGKPQLISKYNLIAVVIWLITFVIIGTFFRNTTELIAIPYIIFVLVLSILFWKYARKNYKLKLIQILRFFPDTYYFFINKFIKNQLKM